MLKDLAKFENDLLYVLTPIQDDGQLLEALAITHVLRSVADLRAPVPDRPPEVRSPHLVRAWEILAVVRQIVGRRCQEDRNPLQLQVALLRYAVHTLSFPEPSALQKQSALQRVTRRPDHPHRAQRAAPPGGLGRVRHAVAPGKLGITICPGRRDRGRDLDADLSRLLSEGVARLLSLSTDAELEWAGVPDLGSRAREVGLDYRSLAIPDQGTGCRARPSNW